MGEASVETVGAGEAAMFASCFWVWAGRLSTMLGGDCLIVGGMRNVKPETDAAAGALYGGCG